jgi:peptidoglycan lytic transglycosylase G
MRKGLWIAAAVVGVGALLGAAGTLAHAWRALNAPLAIPSDGAWIEIASGTPLRGVSRQLAERGILVHPWLLTTYGRITGDATKIRAGEYQLAPGTTALSLLAKVISGQVYLHHVTVVEGWRFDELLTVLRAHPAIKQTTLDGAAIMAELGEPGLHPEGQFYPDTYSFPRGTTDIELLRTAHTALRERLAAAWERRAAGTKLESAYQALILASIIEKETALPAERALISGVFHERLRRGMRLQTDPTVIYGLGAAFDGNLRRQDLDRDTPYNTYTRSGLPPTPIALPGGASIDAAVAPEPTAAIYFVATGRPDGSHYFSATLEEHERAVRDYLRQLRSTER